MKDRRQSPVTVVVLVVLAVGVAWFMFVRPLGAKAADARFERDDAVAQMATLEALSVETTTTVAIGGELDALTLAIPDTAELSSVLRELHRVAVETGMDPATITPSPVTANPVGGGVVQVSLTTSGPVAAADAYVAGLLRLPRLVVVDSVSVTESDDGLGNRLAQVQLTARLFTAVSPVPTTVATVPPAPTS